MSLREDVNRGLAALNPSNDQSSELDGQGWCSIPVPLPPALIQLAEGRLNIEVSLAKTGQFLTLLSPLAVLETMPGPELMAALLQRQFYADHVGGASFALTISGEHFALVAVYHWLLNTISPPEFSALFQKFIAALLGLIKEVSEMAQSEPALIPLHQGHPV